MATGGKTIIKTRIQFKSKKGKQRQQVFGLRINNKMGFQKFTD